MKEAVTINYSVSLSATTHKYDVSQMKQRTVMVKQNNKQIMFAYKNA